MVMAHPSTVTAHAITRLRRCQKVGVPVFFFLINKGRMDGDEGTPKRLNNHIVVTAFHESLITLRNQTCGSFALSHALMRNSAILLLITVCISSLFTPGASLQIAGASLFN